MNAALNHIHDTLLSIKHEIAQEIIGQDHLIDQILIAFFAGGHALIEGVPGLGKTKTIRTFSKVIGLDTKRISFTPDLLPSDLTGNEIYRPGKGTFEVRKGPIFTNILLADEINRTPPKVQSALLEAMEEKKVTIGNETFELPRPFVVFATQNPLEHEGTYPLPEAQLDRFLMRIVLDYPSSTDEKKILLHETNPTLVSSTPEDSENPRIQESKDLKIPASDLIEMIDYIASSIRVDSRIYDYVSDLLSATRALTQRSPDSSRGSRDNQGVNQPVYRPTSQPANPPLLSYGASTRAGLALIRCAKVRAVIMGREYVLPEDIKFLAHAVLDHRIGLSYESMSEGKKTSSVIEEILESVRVV